MLTFKPQITKKQVQGPAVLFNRYGVNETSLLFWILTSC